ncbi:4'-phosphopantetheinyl transferase family protein [Hyphococcus lacteus]|uniref:4'-phosphopantetheinyl transferase superfamily protein n=1 Tax=Hyphococcus lacteus TaxID=3143536 RepID=A0ABV3Z761_9PROT
MGTLPPDYTHCDLNHGAPTLLAGEVHCWLVPVSAAVADEETLDDEERNRAARFHFEKDRNRFCAGRVWQRRILGAYLGQTPSVVVIEKSAAGKPRLSDEPFSFNYSRSGDWGLLAVSHKGILGADIEQIRQTDDLPYVARAHFSDAERRALDDLSGEQWFNGFFACWTRKEAVVKAIGEGLLIPLDCFDVAIDPDAPARILGARAEAVVAADWSMASFRPAPGYLAAIASNIPDPKLCFYLAESSRPE